MSNSILDTFENPNVGREYEVNFDIPEFTCLCPLTGQPDFAHFYITYIPDKLCIELKSLKLYFFHSETNLVFTKLLQTKC